MGGCISTWNAIPEVSPQVASWKSAPTYVKMFATQYNGGYWASIITKRDEAALCQQRTYFRNERGKGPLVANPLWRARANHPYARPPTTLSHVGTVEERARTSCVTSCVNIHYTSLRLVCRWCQTGNERKERPDHYFPTRSVEYQRRRCRSWENDRGKKVTRLAVIVEWFLICEQTRHCATRSDIFVYLNLLKP